MGKLVEICRGAEADLRDVFSARAIVGPQIVAGKHGVALLDHVRGQILKVERQYRRTELPEQRRKRQRHLAAERTQLLA